MNERCPGGTWTVRAKRHKVSQKQSCVVHRALKPQQTELDLQPVSASHLLCDLEKLHNLSEPPLPHL